MGCTSTNFPAAIQFNGIDMNNYTVIVEFEVLDKMDNGRWVGISTRLQETEGWYKGSLSLSGNLAINNCTTTDLSKPVWVQAVKETYDLELIRRVGSDGRFCGLKGIRLKLQGGDTL